jgi:hypothetical protein
VPTIGLCGTTADRAEEMVPAGARAAWALGDGMSMEALSVSDAFAACLRVLRMAAAGDPAAMAAPNA